MPYSAVMDKPHPKTTEREVALRRRITLYRNYLLQDDTTGVKEARYLREFAEAEAELATLNITDNS